MVVNTHQQITGDFTRNANVQFPVQSLKRTIGKGVGEANAEFVDATRIASALMGDSIATNLFMLGFAYQKGFIPVAAAAIEKAIELNGAAVKMNQAAFLWGRRAAADLPAVERLITPKGELKAGTELAQTLDEVVQHRVAFLTGYQDAAYAERYRALVHRVRKEEQAKGRGLTGLTEAVARYYFKLLAYKDEYEVARLYTDGSFEAKLKAQFEDGYKLKFNLAPPLFSKRDPVTGELQKTEYGPVDLACVQVVDQAAWPERITVRYLRVYARASNGAPADSRLRTDHRRSFGRTNARQPRVGCADRQYSGGDPRLRACEGTPSESGKGQRSEPAGGVAYASRDAVGGLAMQWSNGCRVQLVQQRLAG
jgi:hypothetical protein